MRAGTLRGIVTVMLRIPLLALLMVVILWFGATLPRDVRGEDSVSAVLSVNGDLELFTPGDLAPRFSVAMDGPSPGPGRSFGCLQKRLAGQAGVTQVKKLAFGGLERDYRVHVSARASAETAQPIVLAFHGRGGRGADFETSSGLLPVSDREGFLLVSPDGTGTPRGWGAGASMPSWPVDDTAFVGSLLDRLEADFCVDTTRIYAVGHSNGGFLASRIGCALGDRIAAIVPVAGISLPAEPCHGAVAVLTFHGTADDVVPFNGGPVRKVYTYAGVRSVLSAWSALARCSGAPVLQRISARVVRENQQSCVLPVSLVQITGGGHEWPTDRDVKVAETIWTFLKDQHKP